jgi:predicted DNA-binding transcriptional regulator AlpA
MSKVNKSEIAARTSSALPKMLLTAGEVTELTNLSRNSIYSYVADGKFPRPVHLGYMRSDGSPSKVAWLYSEVMDWVADLAINNRVDGYYVKTATAS